MASIVEPMFKGGVLELATGAMQRTISSWSLEIGDSREGGYPRYSEIDVYCVALMRQLTAGQGIAPRVAAPALNEVRAELAATIDALFAEDSAAGKWRWDGGPYLVLFPGLADLEGHPNIGDKRASIVDDLEALFADRKGPFSTVIVPLPKIVRKTRMRLDLIKSGEIGSEANKG